MQKIWSDSRSGVIGCMVGNFLLDHLSRCEEEPIVHDKGTIFSTAKRIFVGRSCSSSNYFQQGKSPVVHFCNMSKEQHQSLNAGPKQLWYLFFTVTDDSIRYWLIPGKVVWRVLKNLKAKPSSSTCILRISQKGNETCLGSKKVSQYHHTLPLPQNIATKVARSHASRGNGKSFPVQVQIEGHPYQGTLRRIFGKKKRFQGRIIKVAKMILSSFP